MSTATQAAEIIQKETIKEPIICLEPSRLKETIAPQSTGKLCVSQATAFNLFVETRRYRVMKSNPTASLSEVRKILGAAWKKMDASEKRPWSRKAEEINQGKLSVLSAEHLIHTISLYFPSYDPSCLFLAPHVHTP